MTCDDCAAARKYVEHRIMNVNCIYCGARYYQALKTWPAPRRMPDGKRETKAQRSEWREKVIADWTAWGHDRAELLALGNSEKVPFEPVTREKKR